MANLGFYFTEDDLLDYLVVDSEGYICGKVDSFKVETNKISINIYVDSVKSSEVPNEQRLQEILIDSLPKKGGIRSKKNTVDDLHVYLREELKLSESDSITLSDLLRLAEREKVAVPTDKSEVKEKKIRMTIDWNLVDKIGISELGNCILLNKPVEAERRNIKVTSDIPYYETEFLRDRMVIGSDARIVGAAERILIMVNAQPGLLVRREKVNKTESPDVNELLRKLVPSQFKDEKELCKQIATDNNLKGTYAAEDIKNRYLISWAQAKNIEVPKKVETHRDLDERISVEWSKIRKIGEVIIMIESAGEISSSHMLKKDEIETLTQIEKLEAGYRDGKVLKDVYLKLRGELLAKLSK